MSIINQKAIIAACAEFGARIGDKLDSREGDAFDIALKACLAALASKPQAPSPSTTCVRGHDKTRPPSRPLPPPLRPAANLLAGGAQSAVGGRLCMAERAADVLEQRR